MKTSIIIASLVILSSLVISCEESTETEYVLPISGTYESETLVYYRTNDSVSISDYYTDSISGYFMYDVRDTRIIPTHSIYIDEIGESLYRLRFNSADTVLPEEMVIKVGSYYIYSANYDIRAKIWLEPHDQFELREYRNPGDIGYYSVNNFRHSGEDVYVDMRELDYYDGWVHFDFQVISKDLDYMLWIGGNRRL